MVKEESPWGKCKPIKPYTNDLRNRTRTHRFKVSIEVLRSIFPRSFVCYKVVPLYVILRSQLKSPKGLIFLTSGIRVDNDVQQGSQLIKIPFYLV